MNGWYPDPTGRFDYRWHNGREWTADVSREGTRYIDPPIPPPAAGRGDATRNGLAVAGMVCGIVALLVAWIPFVGILGLLLAVVALVLAGVGLARARALGAGRGFAVTGLVTGGLAILAGIVGIVLSVALVGAIDRYERPGRHEAEITSCTADGRRVEVEGTIENLGVDQQTYTVQVWVRRGSDRDSDHVIVEDVAPGTVATFATTVRTDEISGDVSCELADVNGPPPFGIDPDVFDS